MIADIMMKEKTTTSSQAKKFDDLFIKNKFMEGKEEFNNVVWKNEEIILRNPKEKEMKEMNK